MPASPLGKSDRDCDGMTVFSYLLLLLVICLVFSICCLLQFKGAGSAVDGEDPCATGVVAAGTSASCGDG